MAENGKKLGPVAQFLATTLGVCVLFMMWCVVAAVCIALLLGCVTVGWYVKEMSSGLLVGDGPQIVAGLAMLIAIMCSFAFIRQTAVWLSGGAGAASPSDRPKPLYVGGHQPSDVPTNNKRGSDGRPIPPGSPPSGGSSGDPRVPR